MAAQLFPTRLRRARVLAELSQDQLAKHLDLSGGMVLAWEKGRSWPNYIQVNTICDVLKVSADWLLGRTDGGGPATAAER